MNYFIPNFSQYENFLLLLQSRYEKRKEILTRFTYSTLLSNFLKNRSILLHKSFSNLFPNRNRGGERGRESIRGPHAWYPRQTYSPRTGTTPKESRSRKSRGTREINQAGRRVKWTETRFGAIKGPSTN